MQKKFMTILRIIAKEIVGSDVNFDDVNIRMNIREYDLSSLSEDLRDLESMDILSEEDIDTLKAFLSYVVVKDTYLDSDDIYTVIFGKGKRITWH
ncbi:MAG: hypothetical protein SFH39_02305 [Candidatus Magnetobacterium sp. LHC-1]|uniref:Uncharacterized protein n=1 Tax=Candidatus Magnetobacterium casense TaxID=1455061 RepID=A0ABS6RZS0_9BACT|nr:hypothetical protein [Candidatus Magnetobacterium casensis]MBF0607767.1 hypothetical protein [Nitrospirota bacterium]MBV6342103.1 hypothetical protein [Candidatus Magnetobacterium casensis]